MKKILMMSMCALALLMATTITSSGSEVTQEAPFTIKWDIEGGAVNIIVDGFVTLTGLTGGGSMTFKEDLSQRSVAVMPAEGFVLIDYVIEGSVNMISVTATVAPMLE